MPTEFERYQETISIMMLYNRLKNDTDAYLYEWCLYAKGQRKDRPNPEDYGIEIDNLQSS